jgi:hypothetical protein
MQTILHAFKLSARYTCCLHYGLTLYTKNYKCFNKYQTKSFEFYVSLTVHLGIILVKTNLTHFIQCIYYFTSLHVSST